MPRTRTPLSCLPGPGTAVLGVRPGQGLQKQLLKQQSCGGECELGVETAKGKGEKAGLCGGGRQTVIQPRRASAGLHRMAPVRITHRQKHLLNPKDWGFICLCHPVTEGGCPGDMVSAAADRLLPLSCAPQGAVPTRALRLRLGGTLPSSPQRAPCGRGTCGLTCGSRCRVPALTPPWLEGASPGDVTRVPRPCTVSPRL